MSVKLGKVCSKCNIYQEWSGFHKNRARSDGHAQWCKACIKQYAREYNSRPEVKERVAKQTLARYHQFPAEKKLEIQKRRYKMGRHFITKYNITLEDYDRMLAAQGGTCAICDRPPKEGRRLAVDHDHACCDREGSCGECVRGLLCTTCNVWLGFYENKDWIGRADQYIDRAIKNLEEKQQ